MHAYLSRDRRGALFQSISGKTNFKYLSWPIFLDQGVLDNQNVNILSKPGTNVDICSTNSNDCWCGAPTQPPVDVDFVSGSGSGEVEDAEDTDIPVFVENSVVVSQNEIENKDEDSLDFDFDFNDLSKNNDDCSPMDLICNGQEVYVPELQEISCSRQYQKVNFGLKNVLKLKSDDDEKFFNVGASMMKAKCAVDENCVGFVVDGFEGSLVHAISGEKVELENSELSGDFYLDIGIDFSAENNLSIDEVKCDKTYSQLIHLSNENTAEERVIDTLSDIFESFAISNINSQTRPHSRRIKRSTDQVLTQIQNYGCWCSKPFTGTSFQGLPLDHVDSVCRQWSKCTRCEMLTNCDNNGGDSYSMVYSHNSTEFECYGDSQCSQSRCLCSGSFGLSLASYFVKGGSLSSDFSDVQSSMCQHSKIMSAVSVENKNEVEENRSTILMEQPVENIQSISDSQLNSNENTVFNENSNSLAGSPLIFEVASSSSTSIVSDSNDSIQALATSSSTTAQLNLVNMEETCCGEAPTWQPYHLTTHSCTDGQLIEL